jgi:mono/diheme cytochrome c family protein
VAICAAASLSSALAGSAGGAQGAAADAIERGRYVFREAGGCSCHTDTAPGAPPLAGGRPIRSPFGVFYATNITPDRETGIGRWTEGEFLRAMREGIAPDGSSYFPAFPYPSFTRMSEPDLRDLWAFLRVQPAVHRTNRPHEVRAPFGWRFLVPLWKRLYFDPGAFRPDPARSGPWNRGAYLVTGAGHCSECHTPRGLFGSPRQDLYLAGAVQDEKDVAPNITPDDETGIGRWQAADVIWLLQTGLAQDGDTVQGSMSEAIEQGYKHLSESDLQAIATYLRGVRPIRNQVEKRRASSR